MLKNKAVYTAALVVCEGNLKNEPNHGYIKDGVTNKRTKLRTEGRTKGRTDARTDARTDELSYRDARTHLKKDLNGF